MAALVACGGGPHPLEACLAGAYTDGSRTAVVTAGAGQALRWRELDGSVASLVPSGKHSFAVVRGHTPAAPPSGLLVASCENGEFHDPSADVRFRRLALREVPTEFASGAERLHGKFVVPATAPPHDYVVLVHGSEDSAATRYAYQQYIYAAQGIAVLVFDKRGTGDSSGRFSSNFEVLAGDVVAALAHAREAAPTAIGRLGVSGFSQGGWVAPLAALRDGRVDFVQVSYGLVDSPLSEDREQAFNDIRAAGFDESAVEAARPLIDAMHAAIASGFAGSLDELAQLEEETAEAPWRSVVEGEVVGDLLRVPVWLLPTVARFTLTTDLIWDYDSTPVLEAIDVPFLWVVAGADTEAPPEQTLAYLRALAQRNANLEVVDFPDTDHGILEFELADGQRRYTRYAPGYFTLLATWIADL